LKKLVDSGRYQATSLRPKMLLGDETQLFLQFVDGVYETSLLNQQARQQFYRHKTRDLAILALFLASGIKTSELIRLNLGDVLFLESITLKVIRRSGQYDNVLVANFASIYLHAFIIERGQYLISESAPLFVTFSLNTYHRISDSTIYNLVGKYTATFKVRISPKVLRHTFATRLYEVSKSIGLVATQLGYSSTLSAELYVQYENTELLREIMHKL
jgi:integrase/recombinase XerD